MEMETLADLPFHVSTLRQIHSYHDAHFGFEKDLYLNLGHTQYALYYIVADFLSYFLGVRWATMDDIADDFIARSPRSG